MVVSHPSQVIFFFQIIFYRLYCMPLLFLSFLYLLPGRNVASHPKMAYHSVSYYLCWEYAYDNLIADFLWQPVTRKQAASILAFAFTRRSNYNYILLWICMWQLILTTKQIQIFFSFKFENDLVQEWNVVLILGSNRVRA